MAKTNKPSKESEELSSTEMTAAAEKIVNKLGMDLTKEDIVAAKISQLEDDLEEQTLILEKEINAVHKSCNEIQEQITKKTSDEVRARYNALIPKKIDAINKTLEGTLTKFHIVKEDINHTKLDDNPRKLLVECCLKVINKDDKHRNTTFDIQFELEKSKELLKLEEDLSANGKLIQEKNQALSLIIKKLKDIPKLERKIKAKLATRVIANMEGGKAILNLVQLDV